MSKHVRNVEWGQVEYRLNLIGKELVKNDRLVCYLANMGGVSKISLEEIVKNDYAKLIYLKKFGKGFLQLLLAKVFKSYWAVIQLLDSNELKFVFDELCNQTMVELYIFDESRKISFEKTIKRMGDPMNILDHVASFDEYFIYQVDTDNIESKTGTQK